jgi:hypothetical protein
VAANAVEHDIYLTDGGSDDVRPPLIAASTAMSAPS